MKALIALLVLLTGPVAAQTTVTLPAPDILGVSCGGYQSAGSSVTIVGFDAAGHVQGILKEVMTCSSGGRGSHPVTFTGSTHITWDFRGGYVTSWNAALAIPSVGNVATDHYGNVAMFGGNIYTLASKLTIQQLPPNPVYLEAQVPNLIGDTDAQAQAAIGAAGLFYSGAYTYSTNPSYGPGIAYAQQPKAGTLVPFGTGVLVWENPAAPSGGGDN